MKLDRAFYFFSTKKKFKLNLNSFNTIQIVVVIDQAPIYSCLMVQLKAFLAMAKRCRLELSVVAYAVMSMFFMIESNIFSRFDLFKTLEM